MNRERKNIRLRPFTREDRKITLSWRNIPEIRDAVMGFRFPVTDVMEDLWYDKVLEGNDDSRTYFAIETFENNVLIGFCSLTDIDYQSSNAQFGIMIGESLHHGKGMGSDALGLALSFAFQSLNLHRVYVMVRENNVGAVGLFKKFGFCNEGVLKDHYFVDDQYESVLIMALLRDQFKSALV